MGSRQSQKPKDDRASMERKADEGWKALAENQFSKAEKAYAKAVELAQKVSDMGAEAIFLSYLGVSKQGQGRSQEAQQDLQSSISIARECGLLKIEAHGRLLLGELFTESGRSEDAMYQFLEALEASFACEDLAAMEISLGNLGKIYLERGWAEQASECFRQALDLRDDTPNKASWLGSMGLALAELGQFDQAINFYNQAYLEAELMGDIKTRAICKGSEGNVLFEIAQYESAVACYEEAHRLSNAAGDGRREGIWLGNIGTTWLKLNDTAKAIEYCGRAVQIARDLDDRQSAAAHLDSLGDCYAASGELALAEQKYQEAFALSDEIQDRQGQRIYLTNLGKVSQQMGQLKPAFDFLSRAIDLFDAQRSAIKADDLKTSFANRGQELYRDMVKLCLSMGKRTEALEYVGRAKSRALLDLLSNSPIDISQLADEGDESLRKLIRREAELRTQIAHFERLFWQGPPASSEGTRGAVVSPEDSQKIYGEWRDVVNQLKRRHPNYASLVSATTLDYREILSLWDTSNESSARLDKNAAIIEFYWTDQFLITAAVFAGVNEPILHFEGDSQKIESLHADLAMFLEMSATEGWEVPLSLCKRLYQQLFASLLNELPGNIDRLILVPHGELYHLPFSGLHDGKGYLCERFAVSCLPTTSLIPVLAQRESVAAEVGPKYLVSAISDYSATRKEGLVLSSRLRSAAGLDDLSYTMEEAQNIFDLGSKHVNEVRLLTNSEVKDSLPEMFGNYPVVHFAGHAVFNPDEPLASGLVLSDGTILTAASILQANSLRTSCGKLLVLSACQTGVNLVTAGGEILGLARALMYAGMPNLVLSLWEVADRSTANLMQDFHSFWSAGKVSIAEALRQAQCKALKEGQPIHAWAPFIHMGVD